MPELPDLTLYLEAIEREFQDRRLERVVVRSPFVLRSVTPPPAALEGRRLHGTRRIGKRVILDFGAEHFLAIHLMIAGRFKRLERGRPLPKPLGLAALEFENATLALTEASKKKRAALHVVCGESALAEFDRGGLEPLRCDASEFKHRLLRENRTLKRALTDPDNFAGIGNAYSDEILHHARLSPIEHTRRLDDDAIDRLHGAVRAVLSEFTERMRRETQDGFPSKVTAFRPDMAVHGRFGLPCPDCGGKVARLVYAENESNYCPTCQTGGRLLADRALSRLLRGDWPKSWEELEERKRSHAASIESASADAATASGENGLSSSEDDKAGRGIPKPNPKRGTKRGRGR